MTLGGLENASGVAIRKAGQLHGKAGNRMHKVVWHMLSLVSCCRGELKDRGEETGEGGPPWLTEWRLKLALSSTTRFQVSDFSTLGFNVLFIHPWNVFAAIEHTFGPHFYISL